MLEVAYGYASQLNAKRYKTLFDDKYKYYHVGGYAPYNIKLDETSRNGLEFVSVDSNGEVIGYLYASIERDVDKVSGLAIINFSDKGNLTFSKDLHKFLTDLFEKFNFRKIEFEVTVGNPIEKMYDKYIKKYGGKVVGILHECHKLSDNQLYDTKIYEIFRDNYMYYKYNKKNVRKGKKNMYKGCDGLYYE